MTPYLPFNRALSAQGQIDTSQQGKQHSDPSRPVKCELSAAVAVGAVGPVGLACGAGKLGTVLPSSVLAFSLQDVEEAIPSGAYRTSTYLTYKFPIVGRGRTRPRPTPTDVHMFKHSPCFKSRRRTSSRSHLCYFQHFLKCPKCSRETSCRCVAGRVAVGHQCRSAPGCDWLRRNCALACRR